MDRLKEARKAEDLVGYATAPTISEIAQKVDKEAEAKEVDIQIRLISSTAMGKEESGL